LDQLEKLKENGLQIKVVMVDKVVEEEQNPPANAKRPSSKSSKTRPQSKQSKKKKQEPIGDELSSFTISLKSMFVGDLKVSKTWSESLKQKDVNMETLPKQLETLTITISINEPLLSSELNEK
jgi:hypothetical protein